MWDYTKIEKVCENELQGITDTLANATDFFVKYTNVRSTLCKEIYSEIAKIEPNLTDHGEKHIQNVLLNSYDLIKDKLNQYQPLEKYILCMSILIHDIGNLHGRKGHEKTLTKIFNPSKFTYLDRTEMKIIIDIAKAHGGRGDTISSLIPTQLDGKPINSPCIAAVLRFADELAEGPQRTSLYMIENNLISKDSLPYHQYARILSQPAIRENNIILQYNITVNDYTKDELRDLLKITFSRIEKLNQERIYCGHYSEIIQRIKKVIVKIEFYKDKDSFDCIEIDNSLVDLELSNLNCTKKDTKNFEDHINQILAITQVYVKD